MKSLPSVVSEHFKLSFDQEELAQLDMIKLSDGLYHVVQDNKSYEVSVESLLQDKFAIVIINDRRYKFEIQDQYDRLIDELGFNQAETRINDDVKAPMPGMVLEIKVKSGDLVQEGDPLIILEAMKMENVIKSPGSMSILSVEVTNGQAVDKGQVLVKFDVL